METLISIMFQSTNLLGIISGIFGTLMLLFSFDDTQLNAQDRLEIRFCAAILITLLLATLSLSAVSTL